MSKKQQTYNLAEMLNGIPQNVWDLFIPNSEEEMTLLEDRLKLLRFLERERNKVMKIQRDCGLPLRPNESYEETMVKLRIENLRDRNKRNRD